MTGYNDGGWRVWNGESTKPATVHRKSIIEYLWHDEAARDFGVNVAPAGFDEHDLGPSWSQILKFRVIREHKEPREFWIGSDGVAYKERQFAPIAAGKPIIHVREVLE